MLVAFFAQLPIKVVVKCRQSQTSSESLYWAEGTQPFGAIRKQSFQNRTGKRGFPIVITVLIHAHSIMSSQDKHMLMTLLAGVDLPGCHANRWVSGGRRGISWLLE